MNKNDNHDSNQQQNNRPNRNFANNFRNENYQKGNGYGNRSYSNNDNQRDFDLKSLKEELKPLLYAEKSANITEWFKRNNRNKMEYYKIRDFQEVYDKHMDYAEKNKGN